jgi:hypothetical protein
MGTLARCNGSQSVSCCVTISATANSGECVGRARSDKSHGGCYEHKNAYRYQRYLSVRSDHKLGIKVSFLCSWDVCKAVRGVTEVLTVVVTPGVGPSGLAGP